MAYQAAYEALKACGLENRVRLFDVSSATVELAAAAVGCIPAMIAKTLSFDVHGQPVLIVAAGDARIDNARFKAQFGCKAKMLMAEQVESTVGHAVGGVCPFGRKGGVRVYLDVSLKRFEMVYPACGTGNSAVELHIDELEKAAQPEGWVDVCKNWQGEQNA